MRSRDDKGIEHMNTLIQRDAGTGYQASADSSADLKEEKDIDSFVIEEVVILILHKHCEN